jgi:pimeloyl-ACP methyl ester carboxylesterase
MVDDIEAARVALGLERWVFWGMSGGGWLAQLYAKRHPDALTGLILESICPSFRARLADPACLLSPNHPAWRETLLGAGLLHLDAGPVLPASTEFEWIDVAHVGSVLRVRGGAALLVSPLPLSAEMRRVMPDLIAFDARTWLPRVALPTLVLCGSADPIVPIAHARALHEAIAGSEFIAIDGAGHVPTAERRPEVAAAVRRFLAL